MLPPDHPLRLALADEVHARPPEPLQTPSRASYLAVLIEPADRERERAHLAALCERHGLAPPAPEATHFRAELGTIRFKWERHGEFSGYTMLRPGLGTQPFAEDETAAAGLPAGWLAGLPGLTVVAAHAVLMPAAATPPEPAELSALFDGQLVVGGEVGGGAGLAYTDFRVHPDGASRFVVCNRSLTERQAGRTLQRLFEIEAYRMMALLALPIARRLAPRIAELEAALAGLTDHIAAEGGQDEALLHELTRLAAEIERALSTSQFRFGACRAYHELVQVRLRELRETRLPGLQPIEEFMARRLAPAAATCANASQRLHDLSDRVAQASALLSTRVDIASERQNQALLASMDRRARLQLRLQQTVEGLSVAAIVYYVAGLIGYLAKGAKAAGLALQPDLLVGLAIPAVAVAVMVALRRARRRLHQPDEPAGPGPRAGRP
ncbi:MAG: DUF3422 domain-containing protein [Burkholderiales bacterium]|nr:DUF3422 domain-containing protein [Burkholderiales bacterium]